MVAVESLKVSDVKVGLCFKPKQVQRRHCVSSCYLWACIFVDEEVGRVGLGVFCKPKQVQRRHFVSSCYVWACIFVDEKVGWVGLGVLGRVFQPGRGLEDSSYFHF
jgi:hypothetical protein